VLIEELRAHATREQVDAVSGVLGRRDASEAEIAAASEALVACGARARVEERLAARIAEAETEIARAPVDAAALRPIVDLLVHRDH
jgi:geranylgeranyl diphosphate synthase type I